MFLLEKGISLLAIHPLFFFFYLEVVTWRKLWKLPSFIQVSELVD